MEQLDKIIVIAYSSLLGIVIILLTLPVKINWRPALFAFIAPFLFNLLIPIGRINSLLTGGKFGDFILEKDWAGILLYTLNEELVKILPVLILLFFKSPRIRPVDFFFVAVCSGSMFGVYESIEYNLEEKFYGYGLLSAPYRIFFHAATPALATYYILKLRFILFLQFSPEKKLKARKLKLLSLSILLPWFAHVLTTMLASQAMIQLYMLLTLTLTMFGFVLPAMRKVYVIPPLYTI